MVFFWLILAVVLVFIEALHFAFFAVFLAVGALAATLATVLGAPIVLQVVVFAAVSVLLVGTVRRAVARALERRRVPLPLKGVRDLEGQGALTVDEVGDVHHPGHAQLAGERWLAVTDDGATLPASTAVVVTRVDGTTLVVRAAHPAESHAVAPESGSRA